MGIHWNTTTLISHLRIITERPAHRPAGSHSHLSPPPSLRSCSSTSPSSYCTVCIRSPRFPHHDPACELFYSLKGGVVDYGAEHACRCDHARFGRDEGDGAFPEWDESHPIDLVGHSIGGVTARVLQQLLADGAFPGHATSAAWGPLAHNPLQPAQWRLGSLRPRCLGAAGAAPTAPVAPPPASPRASVARP